MRFRYTLVAEGSTDEALMPLLDWTLQRFTPYVFSGEILYRKGMSLSEKAALAVEEAPSDLLFIHRDSDRTAPEHRYHEIDKALTLAQVMVPSVCVVPIRMMEAWLLFDSATLRQAAGNRNGRAPLNLPPLSQLEDLADPKSVLHEALQTASERRGRRLTEFKKQLPDAMCRIGQLTDDFTPLLRLSSFQQLQEDVQRVLESQGWCIP
jgi:Domain of unknown function (DUF4276)